MQKSVQQLTLKVVDYKLDTENKDASEDKSIDPVYGITVGSKAFTGKKDQEFVCELAGEGWIRVQLYDGEKKHTEEPIGTGAIDFMTFRKQDQDAVWIELLSGAQHIGEVLVSIRLKSPDNADGTPKLV